MPVMSKVEAAFCRSAPWRGFTARVVTPWVLSGQDLTGDVLEVGAGAGANTAVFARTQPAATITAPLARRSTWPSRPSRRPRASSAGR